MNRRKFLKASAIGLGGVLILPSCAHEIGPYRFFSEEEANCIIAISEQVIPSDQFGPGATTAGVIFYIDKQLVEIFTWDQETYKHSIKAVQASSLKLYGELFENLDFDTQTQFLLKMESNQLPDEYWQKIKASDFFSLVIDHTKQGFYGPPRHGGNKDYISYRMLDLEYPLVIGQNRYGVSNG